MRKMNNERRERQRERERERCKEIEGKREKEKEKKERWQTKSKYIFISIIVHYSNFFCKLKKQRNNLYFNLNYIGNISVIYCVMYICL